MLPMWKCCQFQYPIPIGNWKLATLATLETLLSSPAARRRGRRGGRENRSAFVVECPVGARAARPQCLAMVETRPRRVRQNRGGAGIQPTPWMGRAVAGSRRFAALLAAKQAGLRSMKSNTVMQTSQVKEYGGGLELLISRTGGK